MMHGTWTLDQSVGARLSGRASAWTPARWFFDMERSILGDLPEIPPLPDGIEMRPVGAETGPPSGRADHDAFRDHWGGHDPSEANYRRWFDSPEFEPRCSWSPTTATRSRAPCSTRSIAEENDELGLRRAWLDSVFTRRAWRRRGLARALIVRSFHLLRRARAGDRRARRGCRQPVGRPRPLRVGRVRGHRAQHRMAAAAGRRSMTRPLRHCDLAPTRAASDVPEIVRVVNA